MNITRRRGTIAFFITLGVLLTGLTITLNITWIVQSKEHVVVLVVGIILFAVLVAGVVLNTSLPRPRDPPQRASGLLPQRRHPRAQNPHRQHPPLPRNPPAPLRRHRRAQKQEFYKIMLSDSDRLLATVEQVLKAGQLGQRHRQQNRTFINLESLVADCIAITLQRHDLPPDSIVLEPVPGAVRLHTLGIAEDLRTAVINVLDNAVKYSPEGVHIRCSLAIVNYTSIALTITDTGVGLDPSQFKRIFKRFYRVPGRSIAKIKGTGLGLFLVRNIARQHGGDATATSPGPGRGTTITLTLPLADTGSQPALQQPANFCSLTLRYNHV